MGLVHNPLRSRPQRLPLYHQPHDPPSKERHPHDGGCYDHDESSDAESELSCDGSSGSTFSSPRSRSFVLPKPTPASSARTSARKAGFYPYRLPTRVTRHVLLGAVGFIALMILSLIRASQVENWKMANGKVDSPAPPPPVWERFPFLERYYGGVRTLKPLRESRPQYPRPEEHVASASFEHHAAAAAAADDDDDDGHGEGQGSATPGPIAESRSWQDYSAGSREAGARECFLDAASKMHPPPLRYYEGRPDGFPENVAGSYEILNLPEDICFERFGRFGPYGFGYSAGAGGLGTGEHGEKEGSEAVWDRPSPRVDFRGVDWADVQRRCFEANAGRFKEPVPKTPTPHGFYIHPDSEADDKNSNKTSGEPDDDSTGGGDGRKPRTAVVIRCWDEFLFQPDDIANVRAMITELALASGGRYDIHLLVQVKNDAHHPIWADHEAYQQRIRDSVPAEFRGLVTLWTETQMLSLYQGIHDLWTRGPELPVHGVYRGLSMAMQYFAYMHPEYDFFWQWEMDVRYTGHYYDLVTKLEEWAKAQPRKGLWERSSRFYLPAVHGSWQDFSQMARVQSEMAAAGAPDRSWSQIPGVAADGAPPEAAAAARRNDKTVWGPLRPWSEDDWFETDEDPVPPTAYDADRYQWGVGEEADYISLNPIFNPEGTTWMLRDDMTGFNRSRPLPPRRAAIVTTSRMSRRLLMAMHRATAHKKQFAFAEMWPATVALHHGLKAVFAPHPVYVDRRWPVDFLAQTVNGGRDGSSGGSRTSAFGDREHNLHGLSWFYNSGFAPNLYRRWLGLRVNNDGGDAFEHTPDWSRRGPGVGNMTGGEGRMCLPPMLLHPVKDVELPVEAPPEDGEEEHEQAEAPVSDPAA